MHARITAMEIIAAMAPLHNATPSNGGRKRRFRSIKGGGGAVGVIRALCGGTGTMAAAAAAAAAALEQ